MFGKKRNKEETLLSGLGEVVHALKDSFGNDQIRIKDYNPANYINTGEQWCPDCHVEMIYEEDYYECPVCGHQVTEDDIECGYGCATLEASYEEDFGYWPNSDEVE